MRSGLLKHERITGENMKTSITNIKRIRRVYRISPRKLYRTGITGRCITITIMNADRRVASNRGVQCLLSGAAAVVDVDSGAEGSCISRALFEKLPDAVRASAIPPSAVYRTYNSISCRAPALSMA